MSKPLKNTLRKLLKRKTQVEIAALYGVHPRTVWKWKQDYNLSHIPSLYRTDVHKRPNPIVECQCGCGGTFQKYLFKTRTEGGKVRHVRVARRFLRNHGGNLKNRQLAMAKRLAARFNKTEAKESETEKWPRDFSSEYLGEAWLALSEGRNPIEAMDRLRKDQSQSRLWKSLDTLSSLVSDENKLSNYR